MLTREQVAADYTLDVAGNVRSPGKFEGEPWWVVALYEFVLNGCADESRQWSDDESEELFILDDSLRAALPNVFHESDYAVSLYTDSQGFVYGQGITRATYAKQAAAYEALCDGEAIEK